MEQAAVEEAGGQETPPFAVEPDAGELEGAEGAEDVGAVGEAEAPDALDGSVERVGRDSEGGDEGDGVEEDADGEEGGRDGGATETEAERLGRGREGGGRGRRCGRVLCDMCRGGVHGEKLAEKYGGRDRGGRADVHGSWDMPEEGVWPLAA